MQFHLSTTAAAAAAAAFAPIDCPSRQQPTPDAGYARRYLHLTISPDAIQYLASFHKCRVLNNHKILFVGSGKMFLETTRSQHVLSRPYVIYYTWLRKILSETVLNHSRLCSRQM